MVVEKFFAISRFYGRPYGQIIPFNSENSKIGCLKKAKMTNLTKNSLSSKNVGSWTWNPQGTIFFFSNSILALEIFFLWTMAISALSDLFFSVFRCLRHDLTVLVLGLFS